MTKSMWLFAAVLLFELLFDLWAIVIGILDPARLTLPSGLIRGIGMAALGYLFLRRAKRWAAILFAGLEYMTGVAGLVLAALAVRAGRTHLDFTILGLMCVYLAAGAAVTIALVMRGSETHRSAALAG